MPNFLEMPAELRLEVASRLDCLNLSRLALVNRILNELLNPLLYRTVYLTKGLLEDVSTRGSKSVLACNAHHVRAVICRWFDEEEALPALCRAIPLLGKLERFEWCPTEELGPQEKFDEPVFLALVNHAPKLSVCFNLCADTTY